MFFESDFLRGFLIVAFLAVLVRVPFTAIDLKVLAGHFF